MQISKQNQMQPGDNAEISSEDGSVYRTMIEECDKGDEIIISTPLYRGIPMVLKPGREMSLFYFKESGRYGFDVTVVEKITEGQLVLYRLKKTSELRKQQRRAAFRLKVVLPVDVRPEEKGVILPTHKKENDDFVSVNTIDISETGVAFASRIKYPQGKRLYMRIHFDKDYPGQSPVLLLGEVMRHALLNHETETYLIGLHFQLLGDGIRSEIAKYVLFRQQSQLRKMNS